MDGGSGNNESSNLKTKFPIPDGFQELLTSLAREVLRAQPTDIFKFSSLYFSTLHDFVEDKQSNVSADYKGTDAITNQKDYHDFKRSLFKQAQAQNLLGENTFYNRPKNLNLVDPHKPDDHDSNELQDNEKRSHPHDYSAVQEEHSIDSKPNHDAHPDEEHAAVRIQSIYRGYQTRKGLHHDDDDRNVNAEIESHSPYYGDNQDYLPSEQKLDGELASPEEDTAAVKIQAGIRGYLTRKQVHAMKDSETKAATKIQSVYRGFQTRKQIHGGGGSGTSSSGHRTPGGDSSGPTSPAHGVTAMGDPGDREVGYENQAFEDAGLSDKYNSYSREHEGDEFGTGNAGGSPEDRAISPEEGTYAATKIQAAFRGHAQRQEYKKEREAATKIQAGFRGFKVRKERGTVNRSAGHSGPSSEIGSSEPQSPELGSPKSPDSDPPGFQ